MRNSFYLLLLTGCAIGVEPTAPLVVKHQIDFSEFEPGIRKYCEDANPNASDVEIQECVDDYLVNLLDVLAKGVSL